MSVPAAPLLSAEERARLARLALRPRRRLVSEAPGGWRTGRIGSGLNFAEHRPYTVGDDPRYVDWHVAARLGDLVVKLFESEDDLDLLLLVDRSASMAGSKARMARRVAAALGQLALDHQERVRLGWLPSAGASVLAPLRGAAGFEALLQALAGPPDAGRARLGEEAARRLRGGARTSLVAVLSDFHDAAEPLDALRRLRARGHDVLALHVTDDADVELPPGTPVRAVDAETGETVEIDVTPALQLALVTGLRRRRHAFAHACAQAGVTHVTIDARESLWEALRRLAACGRVGRG